MTIAAGFICPDGLVLCADSQFSTDNTKRSGPKVWAQTAGPFSFGIAAAGTGYLIRSAKQQIERALSETMSVETIRQEVEKILVSLYSNFRDPNQQGISLLIGVRTLAGISLLETTDTDVAYVETPFCCFGSGSDLGNYLLDHLEPSLSTAWGKLVAVRLLDQVKRYSLYCGRESQIVVIPRDTTIPHEWFQPEQIEQIEQVFEQITKASTPVLNGAVNLQMSDEEFAAVLQQFSAVAGNQRVFAKAFDFLRRPPGDR